MAAKKTLLEQMRGNPRGDWTIKDVETLCGQCGVEVIAPKRGDHYKVKSPHIREAQIVPAHRPIKPPYIRSLVNMIDLHYILAGRKKGG